jgi:hypothetical protein
MRRCGRTWKSFLALLGTSPQGSRLLCACPALSLDKRRVRPALLPFSRAPRGCTTVYSWNQNHHLFVQNIGQGSVSAGVTIGIVFECTNHAALPSYSQLTSEKLGAK